ncbi:unnamed protein product [Calicophoron daubneyi]|uniref:Uncharacterized protein n=1 Tax=Calicophoron daubneyi TaxID=300641 RepID=A0AAV2TC15_CALDB
MRKPSPSKCSSQPNVLSEVLVHPRHKHKHHHESRRKHKDSNLRHSHHPDDKKHKNPNNGTVKQEASPCGCPNDCSSELQKLRDYIADLMPVLGKGGSNSSLQQLEHFITDKSKLLSEAWVAISPEHLRGLISTDLLAICARREKRNVKHPPLIENHEHADLLQSEPPFLSFGESQSTCGLTELWRRCMLELIELSDDEIRWILADSPHVESIPPPDYGRDIVAEPKLAGEAISMSRENSHLGMADTHRLKATKLVHAADSTTNSNVVDDDPSNNSGQSPLCKSPNQDVSSPKTSHPCSVISVPDCLEDDIAAPSDLLENRMASLFSNSQIHSSSRELSDKSASDGVDISDPDVLKARVRQEITELEMRARAIRSMLKTKTVVHQLP